VPATALALTLCAAFMHAVWNVLVARSPDPRPTTALGVVTGWVLILPVALATWRFAPAAWPYALASGVFETAYVALLAGAYRRHELSVVYPVARGVAPVVVLVLSVAVLGSSSTVTEAVGVLLVAIGVMVLRGIRRASVPGVAPGLAIAGVIACYTVIDSQGVLHAAPASYLAVSMALPALASPLIVRRTQGAGALSGAVGWTPVAVGLLTFGAYGFVLAALTQAPVAVVAAVRETSVVIATGLAAWILHENVTRTRVLGAVLVLLGMELVLR
jgi:drug/metabolite transporter (DMT)-like permease